MTDRITRPGRLRAGEHDGAEVLELAVRRPEGGPGDEGEPDLVGLAAVVAWAREHQPATPVFVRARAEETDVRRIAEALGLRFVGYGGDEAGGRAGEVYFRDDHRGVTPQLSRPNRLAGRAPERVRTERLVLRRPTMDDVEAAHEIHADPRTNVHVPGGRHVDRDETAAMLRRWIQWWADDGLGFHTIEDAATGAVIGFGGLIAAAPYDIRSREVLNLYYRLRPSAWGHGYATEMSQAMIDWARRARPGRPVVVRTLPTNTGSVAVARRLGLREVPRPPKEGRPSSLFEDEVVGAHVEAVREVDAPLRDQLLDCWTAVSQAGGAVGFVPPVTVAEVAERLDPALAAVRVGERALGVLLVDGWVAGFGFLTTSTAPLVRHWSTVLALQIHPRYQGTGLGRTLLEGLHDLARAGGREFCQLTYRDGYGLGEFYAKLGYAEVGRIPAAIRVARGDDRDEVQLVHRLI